MHDAIVSSLRAYSPSAFVALGKAADPRMRIEFLEPAHSGIGPRPMTVVFRPPQARTLVATKKGSAK
jgi:hypothetical protein